VNIKYVNIKEYWNIVNMIYSYLWFRPLLHSIVGPASFPIFSSRVPFVASLGESDRVSGVRGGGDLLEIQAGDIHQISGHFSYSGPVSWEIFSINWKTKYFKLTSGHRVIKVIGNYTAVPDPRKVGIFLINLYIHKYIYKEPTFARRSHRMNLQVQQRCLLQSRETWIFFILKTEIFSMLIVTLLSRGQI